MMCLFSNYGNELIIMKFDRCCCCCSLPEANIIKMSCEWVRAWALIRWFVDDVSLIMIFKKIHKCFGHLEHRRSYIDDVQLRFDYIKKIRSETYRFVISIIAFSQVLGNICLHFYFNYWFLSGALRLNEINAIYWEFFIFFFIFILFRMRDPLLSIDQHPTLMYIMWY